MLVKAQPVWLVDVFLMNNMELYGNNTTILVIQINSLLFLVFSHRFVDNKKNKTFKRF